MLPTVFLIRVDSQQWCFKNLEKDWEDIDEGDWVPFSCGNKHEEDIERIKMGDIILGYSCYDQKKCIESLGRVVSQSPFESLDGNFFLIQKITQLSNPVSRKDLLPIFELDPKLKMNQPTVTLVLPEIWVQIKDLILKDNSEAAEDIRKLETQSDDWIGGELIND